MKFNNLINIPNLLSFYRLAIFPYILWLALTRDEHLFVIFIIISLITDILDGLIARTFHLETEFGARLDSIADDGTYILAILGIILFKKTDFSPHIISFGIFIALYLFSNFLSFIKFRRFPSLHLYSWKIGGYIQGLFFFVLFVFGFNALFYYFTITWGILAFTEHIIIQFIIPELKSNQKGLYWVLKSKK